MISNGVIVRSKFLTGPFLDLQGSPVATLLTAANATVTLCHSKTENLERIASGSTLSSYLKDSFNTHTQIYI